MNHVNLNKLEAKPECNNKPINSDLKMRVNVHLNFMSESVLIKDVPTIRTIDMKKILLAPVIEHIKKIGKPVHFKTVSYYSAKDEMEVYVGVDPINENYSIRLQDLDMTVRSLKPHS